MEKNLISKSKKRDFIYIGCQLFLEHKVENFSIISVWNNLIEKKKLYGFRSFNDFYHLTDLKTFKKLKDL